MSTKEELINERVNAGAEWLDEQDPEWFLKIDVAALDLRDGCRCVLGQLWQPEAMEASESEEFFIDGYSYVTDGYGDLGGTGDNWASAHGFNTDYDFRSNTSISYADLDEAWIKVIKDRCNA